MTLICLVLVAMCGMGYCGGSKLVAEDQIKMNWLSNIKVEIPNGQMIIKKTVIKGTYPGRRFVLVCICLIHAILNP